MKTQANVEFRNQEATDRIVSVEHRYNDNDGAYQVAHGFDADRNAIRLCNRGFSSLHNYWQTEFCEQDKRRHALKALLAKRSKQAQSECRLLAIVARQHKRLILEKGNQLFGYGWL